MARTLRDQGYSVVEADNGQEALQLLRKQAGKDIHLLLTDVVMPQMGGKTLAERLWVSHPDLKVIFFSGHPGEVICHQGLLNPGIVFLQKPFSPAVLARKVREVLDG